MNVFILRINFYAVGTLLFKNSPGDHKFLDL
jgi:hypothetical protein